MSHPIPLDGGLSYPRVLVYVCMYYKVEDHEDTDRTHGSFSATVALLSRIIHPLRTGRQVCAEPVHLAKAGTKVPAKQGTAANAVSIRSSR